MTYRPPGGHEAKEDEVKTVRQQAKAMGHAVVGSLKRFEDVVFTKNGEEVGYKCYTDSEGTLYVVNWRGELVYIAGEDWYI